jgi:hypothetical protein
VRSPIAFVYGNCVFADGLDDGWAAFKVDVAPYAWLSDDGKRARFLALLGALEAIEADVQILRVGRRWDLQRYAGELGAEDDGPQGPAVGSTRARARARYVEEHGRRLQHIGAARPAVFLKGVVGRPQTRIFHT